MKALLGKRTITSAGQPNDGFVLTRAETLLLRFSFRWLARRSRAAPLAILLLSIAFGRETAAAIDCASVKLPSSIVICSDPELMRLADERQAALNEARARIGEERFPELWENQKAWVRSYAARCGVPPDGPAPRLPVSSAIRQCFKAAAEARLAYTRTYEPRDLSSSSVTAAAPAAAPQVEPINPTPPPIPGSSREVPPSGNV
jgi:hypothetical protein